MSLFERCQYQDKETWLNLRGKGLGGSDVSSVVGLKNREIFNDEYVAKIQEQEYNEYIKALYVCENNNDEKAMTLILKLIKKLDAYCVVKASKALLQEYVKELVLKLAEANNASVKLNETSKQILFGKKSI